MSIEKIIILDMIGKELVLKEAFTDTSSTKLNVSELPKGVYFLSITADQEVFSTKFIKQ